jgi:hypothetical protein
MPDFDEHLYDDINASEGRSNLDIEKHLRREVKTAQAQVWLALARELGSQGDAARRPRLTSATGRQY